MVSNCGEYLELRCRLLENLSLAEQDLLQEPATVLHSSSIYVYNIAVATV
jgi:hypothetical protein